MYKHLIASVLLVGVHVHVFSLSRVKKVVCDYPLRGNYD